ncbi:MAG: complex I subunit 5 family protein [Acholeplasmataceae bacterium]
MAYVPILFVFVPILSALIVYLFKNERSVSTIFVAQLALIVLFVLYALHIGEHPEDALLVFGNLDARFAISFYNDDLSLTFVGLSILMWTVIALYTYRTNKSQTQFIFFLMFLEGVFLALIQTNDLFNLFVFLELTTVLVTILIAYKKTGKSFRAGIYYLLLNTVAAMFFLIGIILIYYAYGTINIAILTEEMAFHSATDTVRLAYVFMMSGISVKAALFPVFMWLPRAHGVAQSTISALLSGLIVKGALYLFIRINREMFALADYAMHDVFFWLGTITAFIGVVFALTQKDLKQILAYHTISQVGIMLMGLSSAVDFSYFGGLLHVLNHALFKGLLFLCAGVIIATYRTKKYDRIHGLFRTMPYLSVLLIIAMLSISGAPFFNGFVSKTMVKYAFQDDPVKMALFTAINLGTIASFIKFSMILFGPKQAVTRTRNGLQLLGMSILGVLCVAIGIFYLPLADYLFGVDLSYVSVTDPMNVFEYLFYFLIGYLFYRYVIRKDYGPIRLLRSFNVTFENANYLFILYVLLLSLFLFV